MFAEIRILCGIVKVSNKNNYFLLMNNDNVEDEKEDSKENEIILKQL